MTLCSKLHVLSLFLTQKPIERPPKCQHILTQSPRIRREECSQGNHNVITSINPEIIFVNVDVPNIRTYETHNLIMFKGNKVSLWSSSFSNVEIFKLEWGNFLSQFRSVVWDLLFRIFSLGNGGDIILYISCKIDNKMESSTVSNNGVIYAIWCKLNDDLLHCICQWPLLSKVIYMHNWQKHVIKSSV